ncbi:MAG: hypothetical protein AB8B95_08205 [Pseudohongiellaceae bacterium]
MKRKPYPLRINGDILEALQRWASDDLRSVNGQIEFLLRDSLIAAGRFKPYTSAAVAEGEDSPPEEAVVSSGEAQKSK